MKKFIILIIILVLSACTVGNNQGTKEDSSNTMVSLTSSSRTSSQEISRNDIYVIPESDVPVLVGEDVQEMFESVQKEDLTEWNKKINNTDSLDKLLDDNSIATEMSWYFAKCLLYNTANGAFPLEDVPLPDPVFIRETETFYSDILNKTIQKGYTVYRTDLGGYLYSFMQYDPKEAQTVVVATVLLSKSQPLQLYSDIKIGDSIQKVIELDPTAKYFKKNFDKYIRKSTFHLLTDGVLEYVYSEDLIIEEINYYEDFVLPNYLLEDNIQNIYLEPWAYDFMILPQDYPPA